MLGVVGIVKVSAGCSKAVEGLAEVVVGVLIGPALALEDLYSFIILSNHVT